MSINGLPSHTVLWSAMLSGVVVSSGIRQSLSSLHDEVVQQYMAFQLSGLGDVLHGKGGQARQSHAIGIPSCDCELESNLQCNVPSDDREEFPSL